MTNEERKKLIEEKKCGRCEQVKPLSKFYRHARSNDGYQTWCKSCQLENQVAYRKNPTVLAHYKDLARERSHRMGLYRPMSEAKDCGLYLGVCVAEKLLKDVFENVIEMPHGNPGYDFICGKGYKIDVKSACRLHRSNKADAWFFHIDENKIADYFLCLAFDSRESLNPEHVWLVPGAMLCGKHLAGIAENRLEKWSAYEKPIQSIIMHCNKMKMSA